MSERTIVATIGDEESVRRSLVRMLQAKGLQVLAFASAQEFLDSPQSRIVSCVDSDLRMPGVDGLGFQQMLRTKLPHLSMVFITGHGDIPASVTGMKAGGGVKHEKPVKSAALLDAICRATERRRNLQTANAALVSLKIR